MTEMEVLIDFHLDSERQGPGSDDVTKKAFSLCNLDLKADSKITDIGCGTGGQTLTLAGLSDSHITAVDLFPGFLDIFKTRVKQQNIENRFDFFACSMDQLPFKEAEFDLIWSEGAIYNMGFKEGLSYWSQFLKPGGVIAVSELTWITDTRPQEIEKYWLNEYPGIDSAAGKTRQLEESGYSLISSFILPENCWLKNYYQPMENRFSDFLNKHKNDPAAAQLIENEKKEISMYQKYKDYYSYVFCIAEKTY